MAHLFLSYAHADLERVQACLDALEAAGHKVWLDKEELKAGTEWERAIKLAITESYGVLFAIARFQWVDTSGGDERAVAQLAAALPAPREGGHRFLVDWPRLATFQGRGELLRDLHHSLAETGAVGVKTVVEVA
jgi:hypothetical protein